MRQHFLQDTRNVFFLTELCTEKLEPDIQIDVGKKKKFKLMWKWNGVQAWAFETVVTHVYSDVISFDFV